jgi:hypothetical protein
MVIYLGEALKARTPPEQLAAAFKVMNIRG